MPKWQVWILKKFGVKFGRQTQVDWGLPPLRDLRDNGESDAQTEDQ